MDRDQAFFVARHVLNTSRTDKDLEQHLIDQHDIIAFGTSRRNMDLLHIELTLSGRISPTHHKFHNTDRLLWEKV